MNNLVIKKLCLLFVLIFSNFKGIVLNWAVMEQRTYNLLILMRWQKRASNSPTHIVMCRFVVHLVQVC